MHPDRSAENSGALFNSCEPETAFADRWYALLLQRQAVAVVADRKQDTILVLLDGNVGFSCIGVLEDVIRPFLVP
jgi:hypothetical protein